MNLLLEAKRARQTAERRKSVALKVAAFAALCLAICLLARPSFRIISYTNMLNFEGREVFVLDWSEGGRTSLSACFYTLAERERFVTYLRWRGWVEE